MPTLKRYVNDPGYYIVTVINRQPVTFQLTKDGERHLTETLKLRDRSWLSTAVLFSMIERRSVYTNHSGVGEPLPPLPPVESDPESLDVERTHAARLEYIVALRFESTDLGALDSAMERIVKVLLDNGATVRGPFPLPTRVECYKVLAGPSAKEYRIYTYKRILTLVDPESTVLQRAGNFELPPGVDMKVKELTRVMSLSDIVDSENCDAD